MCTMVGMIDIESDFLILLSIGSLYTSLNLLHLDGINSLCCDSDSSHLKLETCSNWWTERLKSGCDLSPP
jgi:hypothetical protein